MQDDDTDDEDSDSDSDIELDDLTFEEDRELPASYK